MIKVPGALKIQVDPMSAFILDEHLLMAAAFQLICSTHDAHSE